MLWRGQACWREGSLQLFGPGIAVLLKILVPWLPIGGLTIGHVVLYRTADDALALHTHEIVHVRQWERWGVIFPVAYAVASVMAWLGGGHYYWENCFEVEARAVALGAKTDRR
jgi:hypothetical protein